MKIRLRLARNCVALLLRICRARSPKDMENSRAASISCRQVKPLGLGLGKPGIYGASMIKGQSVPVIANGQFAGRRMKSSMFAIEAVKCAFYLVTTSYLVTAGVCL